MVCHPDLGELLQAWPAELPDEFFEVTVDDVRRRLAQLKSERWVCPARGLPASHRRSPTPCLAAPGGARQGRSQGLSGPPLAGDRDLHPPPSFHRKRLEEAPLVTKAFREAQMKEKLERYPKVWAAGGGGGWVMCVWEYPKVWAGRGLWGGIP